MNENSISTLMGGVVVLVIAGMIFNYFRTTNLKTWQGLLLNQNEAATSTKDNVNKNDKGLTTYKVKKGDDLWHISENFYKSGYNYVDIMKTNKIAANGVIVEGQELVIPDVPAKKLTVVEKKEETKTATTSVTEPKTEVKTSIETGEYTTKHGDTYWNIAVRAYGDGYAWTKIYEANKKIFGNPNVIHADVKITIPSLK